MTQSEQIKAAELKLIQAKAKSYEASLNVDHAWKVAREKYKKVCDEAIQTATMKANELIIQATIQAEKACADACEGAIDVERKIYHKAMLEVQQATDELAKLTQSNLTGTNVEA